MVPVWCTMVPDSQSVFPPWPKDGEPPQWPGDFLIGELELYSGNERRFHGRGQAVHNGRAAS